MEKCETWTEIQNMKYYSDPDLKDVREDLEAIKFEMIEFAIFCVKTIKTIVTPR